MVKMAVSLGETRVSEHGSGAGPRRAVCPGSGVWHSVGH